MRARLRATLALALDLADPKPASDQTVQVDVTGHHVAACFDGAQAGDLERVGVDQRQVLSDPSLRSKRATSRGVAITFKPAPGDRTTALHEMGGTCGLRSEDDRSDGAHGPLDTSLQIEVVRCNHEAARDQLAVAERTVERSRGRAEHDERATAVGDRNPVSRPREAGRVVDRNQPETPCGEPLPQPVNVIARSDRLTQDLLDRPAQPDG